MGKKIKAQLLSIYKEWFGGIGLKQFSILMLGAAILSFGLHNIHRQIGVTEGGVLGMVLLIDNSIGIPPWIMTPILDGLCYLLGYKYL